MRRLAVLRPEPGNGKTARFARARGFDVVQLALFDVAATDWAPPDPASFDGLLLTSANAVRLGGHGLATLRALPVLAVGAATAKAAGEAGFDVMMTGDAGADTVLQRAAQRFSRLLHLGGVDTTIAPIGPVARSIAVYAARARAIAAPDAAELAGTTALLHSPRAAVALCTVLAGAAIPRAALDLACLSGAIAAAAGTGWRGCAVAAAPTDDALLHAVTTLDD